MYLPRGYPCTRASVVFRGLYPEFPSLICLCRTSILSRVVDRSCLWSVRFISTRFMCSSCLSICRRISSVSCCSENILFVKCSTRFAYFWTSLRTTWRHLSLRPIFGVFVFSPIMFSSADMVGMFAVLTVRLNTIGTKPISRIMVEETIFWKSSQWLCNRLLNV